MSNACFGGSSFESKPCHPIILTGRLMGMCLGNNSNLNLYGPYIILHVSVIQQDTQYLMINFIHNIQ